MQKSLEEVHVGILLSNTELLKKDLVNHYGVMRLLAFVFKEKKKIEYF